MGNTTTKNKKPHNLVKDLDQIATKYILTTHYQDLALLEKKEYCNKLVILTSKIFNKFLDHQDVKYLEQRMERGVMIDKMKGDKLIYFDKSNLKNLDVKNSLRKKRMCIGIAQFYVKVGHIFAAILKTINPEYIFTDEYGQRHRISILDKRRIPKRRKVGHGAETAESIYLKKSLENNICARRIKALTPKYNKKTGNTIFVSAKSINHGHALLISPEPLGPLANLTLRLVYQNFDISTLIPMTMGQDNLPKCRMWQRKNIKRMLKYFIKPLQEIRPFQKT